MTAHSNGGAKATHQIAWPRCWLNKWQEEEPEYVAAEGDRLKLKVLSPEGDGISLACSEVILPSASGQLGATRPANWRL